MNENDNLFELASEKIKYGENLLMTLKTFEQIEGLQKLCRKVNQELAFLKKICRDSSIKKEHLQCSNLTHLCAVANTLSEIENVESVCKVFNFNDRKVTVDIVCNGGLSWIKVVARNPKSLSQISLGDSSFGVRSILDQADDFIECAKIYPCLFQIPLITFVFSNGISTTLARKLESLNIIVKGNRIDDSDLNQNSDILCEDDLLTKTDSKINKVNLDVSAMLAYCSSVTNGSCSKYKFSVPVLAQQALWESKRPVKPILDAFFQDKTLYCCETARNSFTEIVNTVGGPGEKQRAEEFLSRITVLPDNASARDIADSDNPGVFNNVQFTSDKFLDIGGKIRDRSFIIFTFGDRIQAVTVTANDGFVRAAKQQGINFVVFVHESRALTEQKEQKATKIEY